MVFSIKRALFALLLLSTLTTITVDAATRKKISTKKEKSTQAEPVKPEPVPEPAVEAVKDVKKKKDISDMGQRKLDKMKALQAMNSSGLINFTVSEYR